MRRRRISKRKNAVDGRLAQRGGEKAQDLLELLSIGAAGRENSQMVPEDTTQVGLGRAAAQSAARHEAAAASQRRKGSRPMGSPYAVHGHIDAASAGECAHCAERISGVEKNAASRAEFLCPRKLFLPSRQNDHARAECHSEVQGSGGNASTCSSDHDPLPGLKPGIADKHAPSHEIDEGEGSSLFEGEMRRERDAVARGHANRPCIGTIGFHTEEIGPGAKVLARAQTCGACAALLEWKKADRVAGMDALNARADSLHDPRSIGAGNAW